MNYVHFFSILTGYMESFILTGGYIFVFLSTILEGIPLLGMLVPGHVAIVAAGFLAKIGMFNLGYVICISLAGAILGDYFGYFIGRKFGMPFIDRFRPYFFIKDEYIEKARSLLNEHTGKSMIIGRFNPMTRAIVPFLVGTSGAHVKKFWIFNIIGAVLWVVSSVMLGYLFGTGYHVASKFMGKFILFSIIISLLTIWGYKFINSRFHIFKKFELFILGLNLLSLYTFAKTIQDAWSVRSFMANFDLWVNSYVVEHATKLSTLISRFISSIGGVTVLEFLSIIIGLVFLIKGKFRRAFIMIGSVVLTGLFVGMLKEIFMRVRPDNQLIPVILTDPSFPSAHAAIAATFMISIIYIFIPKINSWVKRESIIVFTFLLALLVGLSRLALNVHWFSDVLSGWALGIFVATSTILFVRYIGVLIKK